MKLGKCQWLLVHTYSSILSDPASPSSLCSSVHKYIHNTYHLQAPCSRDEVIQDEKIGSLAYLPSNTPSFTSFPPFNLSSLLLYPPTSFQLFLLPSFTVVFSLHLDSHAPNNTHASFTPVSFFITFGAIVMNEGVEFSN